MAGKISNSLVALSSAAIIAVYSVGFERTAPAAAKFALQAESRFASMPLPGGRPGGMTAGLPGSYRAPTAGLPPASVLPVPEVSEQVRAAAEASIEPERPAPTAEPVVLHADVPAASAVLEQAPAPEAQRAPTPEPAPAVVETPAQPAAEAPVQIAELTPEPSPAAAVVEPAVSPEPTVPAASSAPASEPAPAPAAVPAKKEPAPKAEKAPKEVKAPKEPKPPKPPKPPKDAKVAAAAPAPAAAQPAPKPAPEPEPVAPAAPVLQDGTFFGWGPSRHGDIQAGVVIEHGRIVSAYVATCETRYPCSVLGRAPQQVVERQSPAVDVVSGATESIYAFYYAVLEALSKAR